MAGLTKTYTGDFGVFIAGKIYGAIKDYDDKKRDETAQASKEVKDAAKKLTQNDPKSIPVQDSSLRETVVKNFIPLEAKILQTKATSDAMSAKITTIGAAVADTQSLIINQNQILEEKLDAMLGVLNMRNETLAKAREDAVLEELERQLEQGNDVSGTFGLLDTGGGDFAVMQDLLKRLGIRQFMRGRSPIARALRKMVAKTIRLKAIKQKALTTVARFVSPKLLSKVLGLQTKQPSRQIIKRYAPKVSRTLSNLAKERGLNLIPKKRITKALGNRTIPSLDDVFTKKVTKKYGSKLLSDRAARDAAGDMADDALEALVGMRPGQKVVGETTTEIGKRALQKTGRKSLLFNSAARKKVAKTMQNNILMAFFNSPKARNLLIKKVGREGAKKLGKKAATGAVKGGFPLVGTAIGAVEGIARLLMGDPKGMLLSFGSAIPFAGWGFAMLDILRDIDKSAYEAHIEPNLPLLTDENFANFFMQAIGITPDQFERGTPNVVASPTVMPLITDIVGMTIALGQAAGVDTKALVSAQGLSTVTPTGSYNFDLTPASGKTVATQQKMIEDRELPKIRKAQKAAEEEETDDNGEDNGEDKEEPGYTGGRPWWQRILDPLQVFSKDNDNKGGGGSNVTPVTPLMKPKSDSSTIEFYGQQGKDLSGEPGLDFSFKDYKNNYNVFPGTVLETGLLYGKNYGNVVVVRSVDPSNGQEFDALYSHFPDGGIYVKPGQEIGAGDILGKVGFVSVDTPGVPQLQPNNAGRMSGWHTSLDFFEPGSAAKYRNADALIRIIMGASGSTPHGLLDKLKPNSSSGTDANSVSSSGSIDNYVTASNMMSNTGKAQLVTTKSSDRNDVKRKTTQPVVVVNNIMSNVTATPLVTSANCSSEFDMKALIFARLGAEA